VTMKYARKGYPEPVPGIMLYSTALVELAISVETLNDGIAVEYLSILFERGKCSVSRCCYRHATFPHNDRYVMPPPTGAGEGQQ
jgi:hypothetical protein